MNSEREKELLDKIAELESKLPKPNSALIPSKGWLSDDNPNKSNKSMATKPVTLANAKASYEEYLKYEKILTDTASDNRLKGFTLDMTIMEEFVNAKKLYLMIGMRPNDSGNGFMGYYTLYVFGLDVNGEIIQKSIGVGPAVYEYLKPCPSQCPPKICDLLYGGECE